MKISIEGEIVEPDAARVSVLDHGFLFGDSIYEVVRTIGGRLFTANEHFARLRNSAARIALTLPFDREGFDSQCVRVHEATGNDESYLRIIVTRGVGEIELHPRSCATPATIVIGKPLQDWGQESYEQGVAIAHVDVCRNPRAALDPAIKSGNYLNNVLAMIEARNRGGFEAMMCNAEGFVTEGATCNLACVVAGAVKTPSLDSGILPGITRQLVAHLTRARGREFLESRLRPDDFAGADECFLTSTTRGVMPITSLDGLPIGDGNVGPVTRELMALYYAALARASTGGDPWDAGGQ